MSSDKFLNKAKEACISALKLHDYPLMLTKDDIYIVWFCKTLQNWKALCSTVHLDGTYVEITYNGNMDECYVDIYKKQENVVIK